MGSLLAGVTTKVRGGCRLDPEFDERLRELGAAIKERAHEELLTPISRANFPASLDRIRRAYKRAEFTKQLQEAGGNLYRFVRGTQMRGQAPYFKACTLAYELHDYFYIDPAITEWAAEDGKKVFKQLRERFEGRGSDAAGRLDRKLLREQILWCTCYGNELKREGLTGEALKVFNALYRFTAAIKTDEMPCYATRAVLSYHLGSVHRAAESHNLAESMYTRAVDFYFRRSRTRAGELEEFIFSTRRVAMCIGFGIGWVNLTRGRLGRAENALTVARSLMVHIHQDSVVRYYIEMLWGSIRRCRAGSSAAKLAPAIKVLTEAREFFHDKGHPLYEARACWELALAYNRLGNYAKSEEHLSVMQDYSARSDNDTWKTKVHVLRSRNLRDGDRPEASLREAEDALASAESSGVPLPLADALIARGEARLHIAASTRQAAATYADALEDFQSALAQVLPEGKALAELDETLNDKIAAVCMLRIAECHVKRKEWREASGHLERWKALSERVEHEWVHELARKVEGEWKGMKDFTVSEADVGGAVKYKAATEELQEWLVKQALRKTNESQEKAAKILGVARPRVGQVLKRIKAKKKAAEAEARKAGK